jgi:hypothetical protein
MPYQIIGIAAGAYLILIKDFVSFACGAAILHKFCLLGTWVKIVVL